MMVCTVLCITIENQLKQLHFGFSISTQSLRGIVYSDVLFDVAEYFRLIFFRT